MLTALITGAVKGPWFRLFDKVFAERNLLTAFQQVLKNDGAAGVDHVTCSAFEKQIPESLWELSDRLQDGTFQPQAIRREHIPKPGSTETRPLGIPTVRDRVVQAAIVNVIEPIFELDFAEQSYGFRPGRSCRDALRRVDGLLKQGYVHIVDADLKGYFDTIPHGPLMDRLREKIADGALLKLIESFLKADILDGMESWTPDAGAPQGAVLSPLLSNIYLNPLDHQMASLGFQMIRYADDFVIMCRTKEEAQSALERVGTWVEENGLILHPTKTKLVDANTEGFDFLGYHFRGIKHWARKKSLQKLRTTLKPLTKRTNGTSLQCVIAKVNRTLKGWFVYFQHSNRATFREVDQWVRQRLRGILRKRRKCHGRARGGDFKRWTNAFFTEQGLYCLVTAHVQVCQPSKR
jgi:RNA-directed DNA polymerase